MSAAIGPIVFAATHSSAGGVRELWDDLTLGLAGHRVPIIRLALYPPADPVAEGVDFDQWTHILPAKPKGAMGGVKLLRALVAWLRDVRPRAVVTAMPACNVIMPIAVTLARVPTQVFVTHHSPTHTHNPKLNRIDGLTGSLSCVQAVVSVSNAVAATLRDKPRPYRAKCRTIHNALPTRIERQLDGLRRDQFDRRAPRPMLRAIALGRLTEQKNYPQLIHAMPWVEGLALDIVGGGEDEAALKALASACCPDERIRFLGHLTRDAALEQAAGADMFVQVSLYEGHSLALIEAARLGLPLIVSDVPEQVEAVTAQDGTRCGIVVPLGDSEALAAQMAKLARDSITRANWAAKALRIAEENSNAALLKHYADLLGLGSTR